MVFGAISVRISKSKLVLYGFFEHGKERSWLLNIHSHMYIYIYTYMCQCSILLLFRTSLICCCCCCCCCWILCVSPCYFSTANMYLYIYISLIIFIYIYICIDIYIYIFIYIPSTRTRRGGSCLRFDNKTFFTYRTCKHHAPARPVRECANLLHGCCPRTSKNMTGARPHGNATPSEHFLHTSHCTLRTLHFMLHTCASHSTLHLISKKYVFFFSPHVTSSHLIPSLLACHLTNSSSQRYYFTIQSLHKRLPSTTLYCKACTKYVPVLLCTTKLAPSTSQYYFALQSLHKVRPSTTLYHKPCTKYVPVLLWTTKLAQSTSQYYSVPQSLHKVLPSTTLYCTQPWLQATLTQPLQCDLQTLTCKTQ